MFFDKFKLICLLIIKEISYYVLSALICNLQNALTIQKKKVLLAYGNAFG